MTIPERFDEAAARNPDQIVSFPSEDERLTYRELADTSRRMAAALLAAGVGQGDAVGVLSPNSASCLQGVLAAGRIGATACPLPLPMGMRDLETYARRMMSILDTAKVTHLVANPKLNAVTEHLSGLTNLEVLALSFSGITDAGLKHLERLHRLRALYLYGTRVTPAGRAALQAKLPRLGRGP